MNSMTNEVEVKCSVNKERLRWFPILQFCRDVEKESVTVLSIKFHVLSLHGMKFSNFFSFSFLRGTSRHGQVRSKDGTMVTRSGDWEDRKQIPVAATARAFGRWDGVAVVGPCRYDQLRERWLHGRTCGGVGMHPGFDPGRILTLLLPQGYSSTSCRALELGRCTNEYLIL